MEQKICRISPEIWGAICHFCWIIPLITYHPASTISQPQPPHLLDLVRRSIHLKSFSLKTEKSHVHSIYDSILFHNKRHPKDMGVDEIRAYLSHLATIAPHLPCPITNYPNPIARLNR
ncbi:site-specific integrase [Egbenema bharatensis]|uniref:site-specific integrase n=1 Tax=Egbenema bharatensis TaxID=3463334 RepID=UPI003A8C0E65